MQKKDLVDVFLLSRPKVLNLGRCCLLQRASLRHKALRAPPAPAPPLFVCFRYNVFFRNVFQSHVFTNGWWPLKRHPPLFYHFSVSVFQKNWYLLCSFFLYLSVFENFFVQEDKFLITWNNFDSENGTLSFVESFQSVFVPGWSNHSPVFIATFVR